MQSVSNKEIGVLVPLYHFYPCVESFLDTAVKLTISQSSDNASLEDFDTKLLEVLFLIRYVDEVKGNVDNLVTLCLDQIDADRLALRKTIEACLQRLERETLINRSDDTYFFLTSEERDINREIKNVELSSAEEAKLVGELVFDDVLKGHRKHRYTANKMDFSFNRLCDTHPVGNRAEGALVVSILTPLVDDYESYQDGKCVLESGQDEGQVLIRLRDDESLGRELRTLLRTEKYLRTKDDGTLLITTKRIHRDLADENRVRREHLTNLIGEMLADASYFVAGQALEITGSAPQSALDEAMEYLIQNTFTKMSYLTALHAEPFKEIQAVLRSDDIAQQKLAIDLPEGNPQAIEDVRSYIDLCTKTSRKIVLFDMVNDRYANRPYGWPDMEVMLLLARLFVAGEVQFVSGGAPIPKDKLYEALSSQRKWRNITVVQRATSNPEDVNKARELGRDVFSEMGPDGEEALFEFLKSKLGGRREKLNQYQALANTGSYPGAAEIAGGLSLVKALLTADESNKFLERFNDRKNDLLDLSEAFHDLEQFYEHQRPVWEKLRAASDKFQLNQMELERDESAGPALQRMSEILAAPNPYGLVKEADGLIRAVSEVNDQLLSERRTKALAAIAEQTAQVRAEVTAAGGDDALRDQCVAPLDNLATDVVGQDSLAHINQAEAEALHLKDAALTKAEEFFAKQAVSGNQVQDTPVVKPRRVVSPSKLVKTTYLETQTDVDTFVDNLRKELTDAVNNNERIEIR